MAEAGPDHADRDPDVGLVWRSPSRSVVITLVVLVVAAAMAGGWWWTTTARARAEREAAQAAVSAFAGAYERLDLSGVQSSRPDIAEWFVSATEGLGDATVTVDEGPVAIDETGATSALEVAWQLPGDLEWRYTTSVDLVRTDNDEIGWQVAWSPAFVHPDLTDDEQISLERTLPGRGDIVDVDGEPIVTARPVVGVFVQPSRVEDLGELSAALTRSLDIDGDALAQRVEDASGDTLVPVITLRKDDYAAVEDDVHPLPGTVFRRFEQHLAPRRTFARAFLGTVGEVTAEQLEAEPDRLQPGDVVGRSGLQATLDDRLRGTAGLRIVAVANDDAEGRLLHEVEADDGKNVTITLRRRAQRAADAALADVERPSALVAIDVPTGDVVAVANGPGATFDLATTGRYPPGSTFKVVTTERLLEGGLAPDDVVACPGTATVDGRAFGNAEGARLGRIPFATAFAQSCNTAFVELSRELDAGELAATARQRFGIGTGGGLGIGAYAGQVPREDSAVEVAAAAIGQGEVLVSPLVAADIAATVARGHWRQPRVVVDPAAGQRPTAEELPGARVLRRLMRAVVTDGSGAPVGGAPGPPVHGKTGTAEYGDADPPRTHAWFIGYQDDLAFAVLVAETADSYGGQVAAPIAADFLDRLIQRAGNGV